jgi:cytochrome b subunit of formate dehydrogenase
MLTGKASVAYVKSHHAKWYDEQVAKATPPQQRVKAD